MPYKSICLSSLLLWLETSLHTKQNKNVHKMIRFFELKAIRVCVCVC